jgi:hydrogenase-1 operon protein HyaF
MTKIEGIAVDVETPSSLTGNVLPLLHELRHALTRHVESGAEHSIDLNSLPMAPEEERQLEALLGTGEVRARLDALGRSEISETLIPGIWRVIHYNTDGDLVGKFLEITDCPAILKSQGQDIPEGVVYLKRLIEEHFQESNPDTADKP